MTQLESGEFFKTVPMNDPLRIRLVPRIGSAEGNIRVVADREFAHAQGELAAISLSGEDFSVRVPHVYSNDPHGLEVDNIPLASCLTVDSNPLRVMSQLSPRLAMRMLAKYTEWYAIASDRGYYVGDVKSSALAINMNDAVRPVLWIMDPSIWTKQDAGSAMQRNVAGFRSSIGNLVSFLFPKNLVPSILSEAEKTSHSMIPGKTPWSLGDNLHDAAQTLDDYVGSSDGIDELKRIEGLRTNYIREWYTAEGEVYVRNYLKSWCKRIGGGDKALAWFSEFIRDTMGDVRRVAISSGLTPGDFSSDIGQEIMFTVLRKLPNLLEGLPDNKTDGTWFDSCQDDVAFGVDRIRDARGDLYEDPSANGVVYRMIRRAIGTGLEMREYQRGMAVERVREKLRASRIAKNKLYKKYLAWLDENELDGRNLPIYEQYLQSLEQS